MSEVNAYKEWLNTGTTNRGILETIELSHGNWGSIYLANWDVQVTCEVQENPPLDESNANGPTVFFPSRFYLEPSETSEGLEQGTSIAISSLDGLIYNQFKAMTPAQRQIPIHIIPRLYWTNSQTTQLINPAPVWTLHSVSATPDVVRGEIRADPLRVHKTGIYYTALEFPALEFAR